MLSDLTEWVTSVVEQLGYVGVAFLVALENLFPPIPSEIVLPLAGFVAGRGEAWLVGMVIAATVGSVIGAWSLYGIAAAVGPGRIRRLTMRYGGWFRITVDDLDRAEGWFDRRSGSAVLLCRCVPLIRSLVSIPAGFRRMPFAKFTLYTAIGSLVWNSALIGAGFALGERWDSVEGYLGYVQTIVLALIAAVIAWFVWTRFLSAQSRRARSVQP